MYVDIKDKKGMTPEQMAEETQRELKEIVFKLNRELEEIKKIIEELRRNGKEG